jgi:hypothetical protein
LYSNTILIVREIDMNNEVFVPSPTALKLFTFCFYIGKNTYHELVHMLYVLISSLDRFHPDFFLVVYHNLGITIDDPRVRMVGGFRPPATEATLVYRGGVPPPATDSVLDSRGGVPPPATEATLVYRGGVPPPATDSVLDSRGVKGGDDKLLLEAAGCDGNVWVEGSAVRNRWHKLSFNKIHVFKNLYDEYDGACFTWIDLDTIVVADLSYLRWVDNYFVNHGGGGGGGGRTHDVLLGPGGDVLWTIPEPMYIQGSFWKLNLSLYHEVLRLDALFREKGAVLKYDLQSIFAVMAWGGGGGGGGGGNRCPFYDGVSRADSGSMLVIGYNYRPDVMNGLGVWDTKNGVGNHVNTSALANFRWGGPVCLGWSTPMDDSGVAETRDCEVIHNEPMRRLVFRTMMYPDKEIHILSLTFDSFFMSNVCGSSDFGRLFPFLLV